MTKLATTKAKMICDEENRNSEGKGRQHIEKLECDDFFVKAVKSTFSYLLETVKLASTKKELLLMQSMQGRAMQGAWAPVFKRHLTKVPSYPNTTIENIFAALGKNTAKTQKARQRIITDIGKYIDRVFDNLKDSQIGKSDPKNHCIKLVNGLREPLGGIKFFENTLISNPENVLVGAYIGGCVDSAAWRTKAEETYGLRMHKGVSMAVNREAALKKGYTITKLADLGRNSVTLEDLINEKVVSSAASEKFATGFVNAYIELQKGFGVSDDAAFISTALLFGIEAAYGFLLMDAIDTWDKSTPEIFKYGQDEIMGQRILPRYEKIFGKGSFPCKEKDVLNIIYLSAINDESRKNYPSCSQRRFVQIDNKTGLHPIESHVVWIRSVKEGGTVPPPMKIAFKEVLNTNFYDTFKKRYDALAEKGELRRTYTLPEHINDS
jgi:hypothetical protein